MSSCQPGRMGPSVDWVLGIEERRGKRRKRKEKKLKDNFENFLETVVSV